MRFDQRKLTGLTMQDDYSTPPAVSMTEDEKSTLERWGLVTLQPDPGEKARTVHLLEPRSGETERLNLFDSEPALFANFASTPTTLEAVKAFADQFGELGDRVNPEPIEFRWYSSIRKMRRAMDEWNKAKNTGDFRKLVQIIKSYGADRSFDSSQKIGIEASIFLEEDAPRLCIRPGNLLDALWVQLTLAIDGQQNLRSCVECRKWFPIEIAGARSDKEYCSNACRMRAYRKRKKGEE